MHFNIKNKPRQCYSYTLGGEVLETTDTTKYLGIIIANDLKWTKQTEYASKKANSNLGMLRRQLYGTNKNTRLTLYKTIIRPKLEYASAAWSPQLKQDQQCLEKVQRRSVRWILKLKKYDSVTEASEHLDLDQLKHRRNIKDAKLYEDIRTKNINIDINEYTKQPARTHTRNNITQQHASTAPFHNSFFIRVIRNRQRLVSN